MTELLATSVCKLSVNVFYDAKARNSFCWKYFGHLVTNEGHKKRIVNANKVYCSACLNAVKSQSEDVTFGSVKVKSYSMTVSTGNLTRHLRDNHQIRDDHSTDMKAKKNFKDFFSMDRVVTVDSSSSSSTNKTSKRDKWLLARDLALWFCKSLLPFDSVPDEGMVDFFKKYNIVTSSDDIPTPQTVRGSALSDVYESMLLRVKDTISADSARHLSLALDLWSDRYRGLNYITFILHYLTTDFLLRTATLSTTILNEESTGEKINDAIEEIRKTFVLDGRSIIAVTDAGNNVRQAMVMSGMMTHHLCLGHALHNLITVDGIASVPEIKALVQKCKKIVKALRCPQLQAAAKKEQLEFYHEIDAIVEMLDADDFDPIPIAVTSFYGHNQEDFFLPKPEYKQISMDNTTIPSRWHVTLELLSSVIHTKTINKMLRNICKEELTITRIEIIILEDVLEFLKRFREPVEILSSQKTCNLNVALVFRSEIIDVLISYQDNESQVMLTLKQNMAANLNIRFPVSKPLVAAALLDSRFVSLKEIDTFLEHQNMTRSSFLANYIKENEIISYNEMPDPLAESSSIATATSNKTDSLLLKLSKKHSINSQFIQDDPIEQECIRYIAGVDPTEPKDGDLLVFWNSKKEVFPYLAALAKSLLCVPATSSPSKWMFSPQGLTITTKRSRLSPMYMDKVIFIHDNYETCKAEDSDDKL